MREFKSIVIIDLETTGLPFQEYNTTKITELSLVACLTSHIQGSNVPRVLNKLTLCLNPWKSISPTASKITGLSNELLEELKPFDEGTIVILNKFFERLPQPICLIAHNGLRFDFPILRRQLVRCETLLDKNLYCADSYAAFRCILHKSKVKKLDEEETMKHNKKEIETGETVLCTNNDIFHKTPNQKIKSVNMIPQKKKNGFENVSCGAHCRRKLNFDVKMDDSHENYVNASPHVETCDKIEDPVVFSEKTLSSFKLKDIYEFLHNDTIKGLHEAESDCLALLSCIVKCNKEFLDWLSTNSCLLSEIKPLF